MRVDGGKSTIPSTAQKHYFLCLAKSGVCSEKSRPMHQLPYLFTETTVYFRLLHCGIGSGTFWFLAQNLKRTYNTVDKTIELGLSHDTSQFFSKQNLVPSQLTLFTCGTIFRLKTFFIKEIALVLPSLYFLKALSSSFLSLSDYFRIQDMVSHHQ